MLLYFTLHQASRRVLLQPRRVKPHTAYCRLSFSSLGLKLQLRSTRWTPTLPGTTLKIFTRFKCEFAARAWSADFGIPQILNSVQEHEIRQLNVIYLIVLNVFSSWHFDNSSSYSFVFYDLFI